MQVVAAAQRVSVGVGLGRAVSNGVVERDRVGPLHRVVGFQVEPEPVVMERARYCEYPITM
jgi:hypothetical protein